MTAKYGAVKHRKASEEAKDSKPGLRLSVSKKAQMDCFFMLTIKNVHIKVVLKASSLKMK